MDFQGAEEPGQRLRHPECGADVAAGRKDRREEHISVSGCTEEGWEDGLVGQGSRSCYEVIAEANKTLGVDIPAISRC